MRLFVAVISRHDCSPPELGAPRRGVPDLVIQCLDPHPSPSYRPRPLESWPRGGRRNKLCSESRPGGGDGTRSGGTRAGGFRCPPAGALWTTDRRGPPLPWWRECLLLFPPFLGRASPAPTSKSERFRCPEVAARSREPVREPQPREPGLRGPPLRGGSAGAPRPLLRPGAERWRTHHPEGDVLRKSRAPDGPCLLNAVFFPLPPCSSLLFQIVVCL